MRIEELKGRSELYSIRVAKLKTDLLDAGQVRSEYLRVTNAIREVLGRSLLSKAERTDALGQLVTVNQFIEAVTRSQTADLSQKDKSPANNEGIDSQDRRD